MSQKPEDEEAQPERAHTADTVPPPPGGDAYSAATEVREAPEDLLVIMRQVKEARAARIPAVAVRDASGVHLESAPESGDSRSAGNEESPTVIVQADSTPAAPVEAAPSRLDRRLLIGASLLVLVVLVALEVFSVVTANHAHPG